MTDAGKRRLRLAVSLFDVLLVMPGVLAAGVVWGRRYFAAIAAFLVALALVPFFLLFENRRLRARELVPVAVMTAVAVAGRMAFYFLPQFKPIVAVVIVTGVAFGAEAGFLSGSLAMLCSNFLFGQGPWTPWQMFALGLIGYVSGFLGKNRMLRKTAPLCAWGFLSCLVYGVFVDAWSLIGYSYEISWETVVAVYSVGLPFNLVLACATVVFLALIARPLLAKLARVRLKYGLLSGEAPAARPISEIPARPMTGFTGEGDIDKDP